MVSQLHFIPVRSYKSKFDAAIVYSDIPGHSTAGGTIPPDILVTRLKPDMVVLQDINKSIVVIELTVPLDTNIGSAQDRKESKYNCFIDDLTRGL